MCKMIYFKIIFLICLLGLAFNDYRRGAVYREFILLSALVAVFYRIWFFGLQPAELRNVLWAVLFGSGFFLIQSLLSKGKWVGQGDIYFGLFLGILLGWPQIVYAIFLAYILGFIWSIGLILFRGRKLKSKIALIPFLSVAAIIMMFWGEEILKLLK